MCGMQRFQQEVESTKVNVDSTGASGKDAKFRFERIETCGNKVGVLLILFASFNCTSEQRTSYLEVPSDPGMLSARSLRSAPGMPTDDGRAYSSVLHEVELTRVGESVGCRLGLGTFEFAASFKYPRVVFARRLVAGDVPWHARYGRDKCQHSHSYIDDIKLTGLVSPA